MSINWALYEQDIVRWYLDEDKPTKETVRLLKDTHHIVVTERQFKIKFGGLKKLRAEEWKAVIPHIRRREAQGIASVVYLSGKCLKLDRTTRAIRRYSKTCTVETRNGTEIDLGIETVGQHRIEIRTPIHSNTASALIRHPRTSHAPAGILEAQGSNNDVVRTNSSREITATNRAIELDDSEIDFGIQMDMDFSVESVVDIPNILTSAQLDLGSTTSGENEPSPYSQFLDFESWWQNGPKRPFQSFWDLPGMLSLTSSTSLVLEGSSLRTAFRACFETLYDDEAPSRSSRGRQEGWVLSKLVDADSRLVTLKAMAELAQCLFISQDRNHFSPDVSCDQEARISDASVHLHDKLLPVIAFLISNNHCSHIEIRDFLGWVIKNRLMTRLSRFLETSPADALSVGSALLKAICTSSSDSEDSRVIFSSGEFLGLVESHRHYLPGPLGTRLLFLSIKENCLELTKLLVSHGVDINRSSLNSLNSGRPPVAFAASKGREAIMDYLISAGADINARFSVTGCQRTALSEAIWSGHSDIVQVLLQKGARVDVNETFRDENILEFARRQHSTIYSMLQKSLIGKALANGPDISELIEAAEMGNQEVSSLLLKHGVVHTEIMERALCGSVKMGKLKAVITLLRRGVDPNARLAQLLTDSKKGPNGIEFKTPIRLVAVCDEHESIADLLYLLVKAGATVDEEAAREIYQFFFSGDYPTDIHRILSTLLQSDCKASWIRPTLLVEYARSGYISNCGELLDTGTAINDYGLNGESALQVAASENHVALVHFLLSRGADVNLAPSTGNGATALYAVLESHHLELADYLIDAGANVTTGMCRADGATILEAIRFGGGCSDSTFRKLLALGAPVNRTNGTASRLLHDLIMQRQRECLELALRAGARTEDAVNGLTPLQVAVIEGDADSLRILAAHGANINASEDEGSHQGGSHASSVFKFLSPAFGSFWYHPEFRGTALQAAAVSRHSNHQMVKFLLEHGANTNAPAITPFGRTALQAATSSEEPNLETIRLLLLHGADVNAPPARKGGVTALQGAAIQGHMEVARLLLAHGALINALPALEEGRTAIEGAAEHGRLEMVRFLYSEGAMPDPFLGFSRAIELAEKECHLGIVKFLRDHDSCNLLLTDSPILS